MAIKSIDIHNVMSFHNQWRKDNEDTKSGDVHEGDQFSNVFHMEFGDGINVIIGENGTGKTTILKMIYAATQWSNEKVSPGKARHFLEFFSSTLKDSSSLKSQGHENGYCAFTVSDGEHKFEYSLSHEGFFNFGEWLGLNIPSVFIPTTEMLSHAKGFLAMNQKYRMPFDGTQIDIIVNASLPETREIPVALNAVMQKISDAIGGIVVQEEDVFYILKNNGKKVEFSLEAEGLRKLGLIWKLMRSGLLEKGSILLWDEPESNLNPELYPLVAEILLILEENGVQVFTATHSYNFAKYLEIRRKEETQVLFHSLYRGSAQLHENLKALLPESILHNEAVYSSTAYSMEKLQVNHIMMADNKLLDEVYEF